MRARAGVVLVTGVVLLAACEGRSADQVVQQDRPTLPAASGRGGGAAYDATESMLYPAEQLEYRLADGAKAPATSAPAYRVLADDVDSDRVTRMARAVGLAGNVEREGQAFVVRSGEARLQVETASIGLFDFARDPSGSVSSDVAVACAPDAPCPTPPPPSPVPGLPSAAEAEGKARRLLDDLGLGGVEVEVVDDGAGPFRLVAWYRSVDGLSVDGMGGHVAYGAHGRLEFANGGLGRLEKVGDYPLVSMQTAVERLRTGFGGGPRALAADLPLGAETSEGSGGGATGAPGVAPGEPTPTTDQPPSTPVTVPSRVVEITGANVVLQLVYGNCPDDPVYVVPAFAFEPEEAGTVIAVTDESLAGGAAAGAPDEQVEPCPGVEPAPEPRGTIEPQPAPLPPEQAPTSAPPRAPQTEPAQP